MNIKSILLVTVLLSVLLARPILAQQQLRADIVVQNANIYTVNAKRSWAHALAVKNGRIIFVGNDRNAANFIGHNTKVINAGGRLIFPDLTIREQWCDIAYPATLSVTRQAIADCVKKAGGKPWILMRIGEWACEGRLIHHLEIDRFEHAVIRLWG